jgi:hypothetical protein
VGAPSWRWVRNAYFFIGRMGPASEGMQRDRRIRNRMRRNVEGSEESCWNQG